MTTVKMERSFSTFSTIQKLILARGAMFCDAKSPSACLKAPAIAIIAALSVQYSNGGM